MPFAKGMRYRSPVLGRRAPAPAGLPDRRRPPPASNTPAWAAGLAMLFVFLSLAALAIAPAILQRRLAPVRQEAEAADEARTLVTRVQFSLAQQMSALRGTLIGPDSAYLHLYAEAAALEQSAYAPLDSLAGMLSGSARSALGRLQQSSAVWHQPLAATAADERGEDSTARLVLGRGPAHYEAVLRQARDLDMAIAAAAASRRAQIRAAERRQDALTFILSVAALLAAAVVAWFGYRMRSLAREAGAREADASRALDLARAAREARERLLRGITHDLKNPLGAADGYAELLQEGIEGELTPGQSRMLDGLRRCHADTLATISELLEVSRAETGTLEIVNETCDLGQLVREAADEFRGAAKAAGHSLDVVAPDSLQSVTDRQRVRRVLGNLVSNAIKYTPPPGDIVLEGRRAAGGEGPGEGGWIELRVLDTGPGIPPGERERVFDEFHRLHGPETQGHGLGLASSRRIARLLGGDITVADRDGDGSVFSLWLPAAGAGESEGARFRPTGLPADRERDYGSAERTITSTSGVTPLSSSRNARPI